MSGIPRTIVLMEGYDAGYDGKPAHPPSFDEWPKAVAPMAADVWMDGWRLGNEHRQAEAREDGVVLDEDFDAWSWLTVGEPILLNPTLEGVVFDKATVPWIDRVARGEGCA